MRNILRHKKELKKAKKLQRKQRRQVRKIAKAKAKYDVAMEYFARKKEEITKYYTDKISQAKTLSPLTTPAYAKIKYVPLEEAIERDDFNFAGCYVIRNRENGKCYVGQSSNIHRRLNQHFRGTVPKNEVFAEDYYTSKMIDKSQMFEVRVVPEYNDYARSQLERSLIEKYGSFHNGYNRTRGG